jgi:hypothetical protein
MRPIAPTTSRTADSTTRTPALTTQASPSKPSAPHTGAGQRILNALMRALATPHI